MSDLLVFKKGCKLMGNHFELTVVADDAEWANERIKAGIAEIQRIERLLTTFSDDS
jgi:thiamine biosynthesis lipoprotein